MKRSQFTRPSSIMRQRRSIPFVTVDRTGKFIHKSMLRMVTVLMAMTLVMVMIAASMIPVNAATGSSYDSLFARGNEHFEAGDFQSARDAYATLVRQGCLDARVLYNLGNCYLKLGDVGQAILNYRRAERISPGDPDIEANLAIARSLLPETIEDTGGQGILETVRQMAERIGADGVTWLTVFTWLLLGGLIVTGIIARRKRIRRRAFRMTAAAALLFVLSAGMLGTLILDRELTQHAVAVGESVVARSGPGDHFTEVYQQQSGYEMIIQREQTGWAEVVLPNGYTGWVPRTSIEIL